MANKCWRWVQARQMTAAATSARFICNGALRFHPAPGTHVGNIHKTPRNRRAFLCFHRPITVGTPNNRRLIHAILHNPSPTAVSASCVSNRFLSAFLSWRTGPAELAPCAAIWNESSLRNLRLADFFEQLWCPCNTLKIFEQGHIPERIAWSHANALTNWGAVA